MTQHQTVLNLLNDLQPHCSNELREAFVPEYRSRINELRKRGYLITGKRCTLHHHKGISQMWTLQAVTSYRDLKEREADERVRKWNEQFQPVKKEPLKQANQLF